MAERRADKARACAETEVISLFSISSPNIFPASLRSDRLLRVGWVSLTALSASLYLIRQIVDSPYGKDFSIFITGASILTHGQGARLYDLAVQASVQKSLVGGVVFPGGVLPFNYPPYVALLFVPLSLLPAALAIYVWVAVLWALLVGLVIWVRAAFMRWFHGAPSSLTLMFFSFAPIFESLLMGQMSLVLLAMWWWAFISWKEERWTQLGVALALSAFKPQIAIFLVVALVAQRRWRALGWALLAQVGLWVVALPFTGLGVIEGYIGILRLSASNIGALGFYPQAMPNLRGLLAAVGLPPDVTLQASLLGWLVGIAIALVLWRPSLRWPLSMRFGITVMLAVLLSPHLYIHDASLLMMAVVCVQLAYLERDLALNNGWLLASFGFTLASVYVLVLQILPTYSLLITSIWLVGAVLIVEYRALCARYRAPSSRFQIQNPESS